MRGSAAAIALVALLTRFTASVKALLDSLLSRIQCSENVSSLPPLSIAARNLS
jgi:hypothetical protein